MPRREPIGGGGGGGSTDETRTEEEDTISTDRDDSGQDEPSSTGSPSLDVDDDRFDTADPGRDRSSGTERPSSNGGATVSEPEDKDFGDEPEGDRPDGAEDPVVGDEPTREAPSDEPARFPGPRPGRTEETQPAPGGEPQQRAPGDREQLTDQPQPDRPDDAKRSVAGGGSDEREQGSFGGLERQGGSSPEEPAQVSASRTANGSGQDTEAGASLTDLGARMRQEFAQVGETSSADSVTAGDRQLSGDRQANIRALSAIGLTSPLGVGASQLNVSQLGGLTDGISFNRTETQEDFERRSSQVDGVNGSSTVRGDFDPSGAPDVDFDGPQFDSPGDIGRFALGPAVWAGSAVRDFTPNTVESQGLQRRSDWEDEIDSQPSVRGEFDPSEVDERPDIEPPEINLSSPRDRLPEAPSLSLNTQSLVGQPDAEQGEWTRRGDDRRTDGNVDTTRGEETPTAVDRETVLSGITPGRGVAGVLAPGLLLSGRESPIERSEVTGSLTTRGDRQESTNGSDNVRGGFDPAETDASPDFNGAQGNAAAFASAVATAPPRTAADLLDVSGRVEAVRERGTSEDQLATPVERRFRDSIGDPGAPVREFGSGTRNIIQDQTLDVDTRSGIQGIFGTDVTERDIQEGGRNVLQFAADELNPRTPSPVDEEIEGEITGGPPPGISLIGPRGAFAAGSRLVSALRGGSVTGPSGAARGGAAGGGAGQSVGRMGEFAVDGVDSVVRAGAIAGVGVGAASELPTQQPTQNVNELDVDEARPSSEVQTPTEPRQRTGELEPSSPQVSELEPTTEPQSTEEIELDFGQGMASPQGVFREDNPRSITEDDLIGELPEPDQDPPSVRERQRRDDLVSFEREFPTGEDAVIGREVEPVDEAVERPMPAEVQDTETFPGQTSGPGSRGGVGTIPGVAGDVFSDTQSGAGSVMDREVTPQSATETTMPQLEATRPEVTSTPTQMSNPTAQRVQSRQAFSNITQFRTGRGSPGTRIMPSVSLPERSATPPPQRDSRDVDDLYEFEFRNPLFGDEDADPLGGLFGGDGGFRL